MHFLRVIIFSMIFLSHIGILSMDDKSSRLSVFGAFLEELSDGLPSDAHVPLANASDTPKNVDQIIEDIEPMLSPCASAPNSPRASIIITPTEPTPIENIPAVQLPPLQPQVLDTEQKEEIKQVPEITTPTPLADTHQPISAAPSPHASQKISITITQSTPSVEILPAEPTPIESPTAVPLPQPQSFSTEQKEEIKQINENTTPTPTADTPQQTIITSNTKVIFAIVATPCLVIPILYGAYRLMKHATPINALKRDIPIESTTATVSSEVVISETP